MSTTKRFIAGAVCPRCGEMDTVRMYRDEEREYRECVKCGFSDSLRLDGRPDPQLIETRVSGERSDRAPESQPDDSPQPIRILDAGSLRRDH